MPARLNLRNRRPGGKVAAATKADSGTDPLYDAYGPPSMIMISADGSIKITTAEGDTLTVTLFGKVQYEISPKLVWSTGSDAVTVLFIY